MATYTTNLNLKKPATSDKIRIADFNNNADLIDAGYGAQDTSMGKLGGGLAIISTGNVHAAISAGDYVYVRKHGTLAEGLYTADSAISANGTLSSSNVTAVSGGGLNALNSKIAYQADVSVSGITFRKFGRVCIASVDKVIPALNTNDELFTIPSGFVPVSNTYVQAISIYGNFIGTLQFGSNGKIITTTGTTQATAKFNLTYMVD